MTDFRVHRTQPFGVLPASDDMDTIGQLGDGDARSLTDEWQEDEEEKSTHYCQDRTSPSVEAEYVSKDITDGGTVWNS